MQWYLFWSSLHPHLRDQGKARTLSFIRGNNKSQGPFAHKQFWQHQHELRSRCIRDPSELVLALLTDVTMDYGKSNIRHYTQPHPQSEERRSLHVNETADDDAWAVVLRMPASLLLQVNTPYRTGVHVCSALSSNIISPCSLGIRFWTGIGSC